MAEDRGLYQVLVDAIQRAADESADDIFGGGTDRVAQELAELHAAAAALAVAAVDDFGAAVDRLRSAIEILAGRWLGSVDALIVALLRSNSPRILSWLVILGLIETELVDGAPQMSVDWGGAADLFTDPESLITEDRWTALLAGQSPDSDEDPSLGLLVALALLAPASMVALLAGSMKLAPPPALGVSAPDASLWKKFLKASGDWVSITAPLPAPDKSQDPTVTPHPVPAGPYDLVGGIDPDMAVTLAIRAARSMVPKGDDSNGGGAGADLVSRTDLEVWLMTSVAENSLSMDVGGGWRLSVASGVVLGIGYAGRGDGECHVSLQKNPSDGAGRDLVDAITLRLIRDPGPNPGSGPTGTDDPTPALAIGPPQGSRLIVGSLGAFLNLKPEAPVAEIGLDASEVSAVISTRILRFFGPVDATATEGVRVAIQRLAASYVLGEGFRLDAGPVSSSGPLARVADVGTEPDLRQFGSGTSGLSVRIGIDRQIGSDLLNLTIHSLQIGLSVQADSDTSEYEFALELRQHLSAMLGPLLLVIDGIGLGIGHYQSGDAKSWDARFLPPTSAGASLDVASTISGGGFLEWSGGPTDRMAGVMHLRIYELSVTAFGIYERIPAGPSESEGDRSISLIMVIGTTFEPGIQLGLGISITGIGGIVGINRRVNADAVLERLAEGAGVDLLFPEDPVRNAPALLGDLAEVFPAADDRFVVGPTLQLNWLGLVDADVGILVQFPGPSKIILLGVVRAQVAGEDENRPLLDLRMDFIGVLDIDRELVSFDATLINSTAFDVFRFSGDAALRLGWGGEPYLVLAIGGFHPEFDPAPIQFPSLSRVALTTEANEDYSLRFEAYLAVTSNTLQFGGRAEASFRDGRIEADGWVTLDVLIQISPFWFTVAITAGFRVRWRRRTLASVRLSGELSGPGPLVFAGKLCIEVLFVSFCWKGELEFGDENEPRTPAFGSVVDALEPELSEASNFESVGAPKSLVELRELPQDPAVPLIAPSGGLRWTQRRVPLNTTIERFEGVPLRRPQRIVLADLPGASSTDEWFSPGSFTELSKSEALNRPAFERLTAGTQISESKLASGDPVSRVIVPEVVRLPDSNSGTGLFDQLPAAVLQAAVGRNAPAGVPPAEPIIGLVPEVWSVVAAVPAAPVVAPSQTEAQQRARYTGGVAVTFVDQVDLTGI